MLPGLFRAKISSYPLRVATATKSLCVVHRNVAEMLWERKK
jgi:hypothetical protein